jgi:hypothetical protein
MSQQVQRRYTNNYNGWYMYFGDHKVSDKWGVHLEAQLRRNEIITKSQQLLLRTGINYHFNNQAFATIGYGYIESYPYGEFAAPATYPESRIWEQVQIKSQVGISEFVSRFRLEQRFSQLPVVTDPQLEPRAGPSVYTNRFRLFSRFSVPFKGKSIQDNSLYATVYDEFFINFGKNVSYNIFDQNRAYAAVGYQLPKLGRLEVGYLNQLVFKGNGIQVENNHTLQVGLISTVPFYKRK